MVNNIKHLYLSTNLCLYFIIEHTLVQYKIELIEQQQQQA